MAHSHDISHSNHEHTGSNTKVILKTLLILSVITIVELVIGMAIAPKFPALKMFFNGLYLILTLLKAYYIVAEFMHLRHEVRSLIQTIVFPLMLFVWFIIAFLWDGNSYKNLRDTHNAKTPVKAHTSEHK